MMRFLCHLIIWNSYVLPVISDGIQEIPFVKKTLQENRKKAWTYYSQKLLLQCVDCHKNVLTIDTNLHLLFRCSDIQKHEVLQRAKRKFRLVF